ncbi:hypothetical protein LNM27_002656 [Enterococcus faecalis]|uniref:hypothetical protein n=1 Tax=Enterococcus faecalis TaxID=1351 RepID=UPI000CF109EB|nr:hypothetical protein [Enterococcus faecalis]EGO2614331.1 hypothetical protein [Enterococcus faecalis]EGO2621270.1 hypothetical protein [Enterococcus faecalis]EGO6630581.1 hypothetical protein [Enterococcus faecalis]EHE8496052.1 hypothetical protein [Enterococcus faecalis]EHF3563776.1 hypothetical protein [Enterococcus faecalis]
MIVDTDKIEWLLENRSQYFINKETGVAQSRLSKLKNNFSEIEKSSIEIGVRLTTLALQEQQIENKGDIKMTKEKIIEMIDSGMNVYGTTYENEKEVAEHCGLNVTEKDVEYLEQYDGEDFEHNEKQFIDGDMIYIIRDPK